MVSPAEKPRVVDQRRRVLNICIERSLAICDAGIFFNSLSSPKTVSSSSEVTPEAFDNCVNFCSIGSENDQKCYQLVNHSPQRYRSPLKIDTVLHPGEPNFRPAHANLKIGRDGNHCGVVGVSTQHRRSSLRKMSRDPLDDAARRNIGVVWKPRLVATFSVEESSSRKRRDVGSDDDVSVERQNSW